MDFLPESEVFVLAQAAKQIYDRFGDRERKNRARFRFVAERFGESELAKMIFDEMKIVRQNFDCALQVESSPELPELHGADLEIPPMNEAQKLWWNRFVIEQIQKGYYCAKVPLKLGDIKSTHARELAKRLELIGNHSLFFAPNQNMYLRNLSAKNLLSLHDLIAEFSTQSAKPTIIGDMVACTGAATCQLGIARPRGAVLKIEEYLEDKGLDLDSLQGFRIQLSGCPNSCANHFSANLGFFGKSKRNGDYSYPAYNVVIGGIVSASAEKKSRFAKKVADISAFHLPEFIYRVLAKYIPQKAQYPLFEDYVDSVGEAEIVAIAESLQEIPSFSENPAPYYDYTSDKLFGETSKERGIGEEHFKEIKPN